MRITANPKHSAIQRYRSINLNVFDCGIIGCVFCASFPGNHVTIEILIRGYIELDCAHGFMIIMKGIFQSKYA